MNEKNKNIYVSSWLLLITFLVILMIVVGGLTRLTDSGLSITKWDLFVGILPPLSIEKWEYTFSLYKKIPEYKLINSNMTLDEFKVIFWWEYVHRLLGRIIGRRLISDRAEGPPSISRSTSSASATIRSGVTSSSGSSYKRFSK